VRVEDVDKKPLAGVRILLDGRESGTTDANGIVNVESDAKPATLAAELASYTMTTGGDVYPDSGKFRAWLPWTRVVMKKTTH
jgi:hypothetical protein